MHLEQLRRRISKCVRQHCRNGARWRVIKDMGTGCFMCNKCWNKFAKQTMNLGMPDPRRRRR